MRDFLQIYEAQLAQESPRRTFWCVRCLTTYCYSHDPHTGGGAITDPCACRTPTPGFFNGREWMEGVS